jgi:FKBP-type peptidyl-prolyl cis-trans isomerase
MMIRIAIFIIIAVLLIGGGIWLNRHWDEQSQRQAALEQEQKLRAQADEQQKLLSMLKIKDLTAGTGQEAKSGDVLKINYVGTLDDGKEFDSSYKRSQPFEFALGKGDVILGFDLGLSGMKVGGKRSLVIPPELGYGSKSLAAIPPNSTLHFTVELLSINGSSSAK